MEWNARCFALCHSFELVLWHNENVHSTKDASKPALMCVCVFKCVVSIEEVILNDIEYISAYIHAHRTPKTQTISLQYKHFCVKLSKSSIERSLADDTTWFVSKWAHCHRLCIQQGLLTRKFSSCMQIHIVCLPIFYNRYQRSWLWKFVKPKLVCEWVCARVHRLQRETDSIKIWLNTHWEFRN